MSPLIQTPPIRTYTTTLTNTNSNHTVHKPPEPTLFLQEGTLSARLRTEIPTVHIVLPTAPDIKKRRGYCSLSAVKQISFCSYKQLELSCLLTVVKNVAKFMRSIIKTMLASNYAKYSMFALYSVNDFLN